MDVARESGIISIGPSVLSADFLHLGKQLAEIEEAGADYVHFDVMDGRFVPNLSIGIPVLQATRRGTTLPVDVHLMVVEPDRWITPFVEAGADSLTFHVEATPHAHRVAQEIVTHGRKAGIALNPSTPTETIREMIPFLDHILVMTVNPGFGGQSFIPEMVHKIERLRALIDEQGSACTIQVDGGINTQTIASVVKAGARSIVAGSAVINSRDTISSNIQALRQAVGS